MVPPALFLTWKATDSFRPSKTQSLIFKMTVANDDQQLEEIKLEQGSAVEEVPPIADEDKKIPWYRFGNYDVARAYNTVRNDSIIPIVEKR